jgi:hypothetical protein
MSKSIPVRELWWEDGDLHAIHQDGRHFVYEKAVVVSHQMDVQGSGDVLKCERVEPERVEPEVPR